MENVGIFHSLQYETEVAAHDQVKTNNEWDWVFFLDAQPLSVQVPETSVKLEKDPFLCWCVFRVTKYCMHTCFWFEGRFLLFISCVDLMGGKACRRLDYLSLFWIGNLTGAFEKRTWITDEKKPPKNIPYKNLRVPLYKKASCCPEHRFYINRENTSLRWQSHWCASQPPGGCG